MRTYDFAPLWRSTVGFDGLFDVLDETQHRTEDNYPPYNIERLGEDRYQISSLAGFGPDEIAVTAEQNVLTVEGRKSDKGPARIPLPWHLGAAVQAAVQPCRLRAGEDRDVR